MGQGDNTQGSNAGRLLTTAQPQLGCAGAARQRQHRRPAPGMLGLSPEKIMMKKMTATTMGCADSCFLRPCGSARAVARRARRRWRQLAAAGCQQQCSLDNGLPTLDLLPGGSSSRQRRLGRDLDGARRVRVPATQRHADHGPDPCPALLQPSLTDQKPPAFFLPPCL